MKSHVKVDKVQNIAAFSEYLHNLAEAVKNNVVETASISQDIETAPLISEEGVEISRYRTAKVIKLKIRLVAKDGQELVES